MLALAFEWVILDDPLPSLMRVVLGLFGAALIAAGLYHARLMQKRRMAYARGPRRGGTAVLEGFQGEDADVARIRFVAGDAQWRLTVDAHGWHKAVADGDKEASAIAAFGEDGLLYALDVGDEALVPLSPGKPITGETRPPLRNRLDDQNV